MKRREVREYKTESGKSPFGEWLKKVKDVKGKAKIIARLDKAEIGNFGDVAPVGEGVSEMRFSDGPGYRIYYAIYKNEIILLLAGGDKGTQKKDVAKAKENWKSYKTLRN